MTGLVDQHGKPLSSVTNKKAPAPALGERYGRWAGEQAGLNIMGLPGGGTIGFNTKSLTLADFRQMLGNYQINSSQSILTFMMHQIEWHIESDNKKIADAVTDQLTDVWSRLVRAQSQALWAGFAPNALQWENDVNGRAIKLTKIKDLVPEDCRVHWKKIDAPVPGIPNGKTTFSVYDGIRQFGHLSHIPVENSYWYPLLMENGNYYGRRLLESAFQPWFFSTLMHLFANRYYERFGEPVPVGRAPYEDTIEVGGTEMRGNELMGRILNSLRNRSTVILPNEKTPVADEANPSYDYQIEYLESQMRGADFERYMTRLDEEMSLAMFTPILMMRTADVGSYNLGTQHTQVYQWMLNAIAADWAHYINNYIIRPMVAYNFGINAPKTTIKFVKMGKTDGQLLQSIISAMVGAGTLKPDIQELGELTGMTFKEVKVVTEDKAKPPAEEEPDEKEAATEKSTDVAEKIFSRVTKQVEKAFRQQNLGEQPLALGYARRMEAALGREGFDNPHKRIGDLYEMVDTWVAATTALGEGEFETPENYLRLFKAKFTQYLDMVKR